MSAAYLTHDGGLTWQMIDTAQLRSNTRCAAAFGPADAKVIISPSGESTLKVTRNLGVKWDELAHFDEPLVGPLVIDAPDGVRMVVGTGKSTRFSTDYGKTWRKLPDPAGTYIGAYFAHMRRQDDSFRCRRQRHTAQRRRR